MIGNVNLQKYQVLEISTLKLKGVFEWSAWLQIFIKILWIVLKSNPHFFSHVCIPIPYICWYFYCVPINMLAEADGSLILLRPLTLSAYLSENIDVYFWSTSKPFSICQNIHLYIFFYYSYYILVHITVKMLNRKVIFIYEDIFHNRVIRDQRFIKWSLKVL